MRARRGMERNRGSRRGGKIAKIKGKEERKEGGKEGRKCWYGVKHERGKGKTNEKQNEQENGGK